MRTLSLSARCVAERLAKHGTVDLGHDFHRCGNGRDSDALSVGYCFTGLYRLAGKADHTEPPVLYSIIIAQPSERKSPVMHFIKAPFDTFESKYNKDHREEMYKAQQDVKALEARVKSMEKEDEPDTAAIAKLRVQADNIRNTTPIRIAVDDITPESLVIELSENDSLLMISDEAGMLSNFNGKYNGGIPNLDLLLKAWNGEKYICNRVIRGRTEIPRPYLLSLSQVSRIYGTT